LNAPSFRLSGAADRRRAYDTFEVTSLTPHIGAEVQGIDFSKPLSNAQVDDLHSAWADWSVLVFRDQQLTRDDHKRAVRYFGAVHTHPTNHSRDGDPEILIVKTDQGSTFTVGNEWHADVTCQEIPPKGSMLYLSEPPEVGGGDTLFADMYLAYELLSDQMKAFLEGLNAMHDGAGPYVGHYKTEVPEGGYPKTAHPIVAVHPVTGRKVLNVNAAFTTHIVGLRQWESKAILEALYTLVATTPKLWCRVNWTPNTVTLWDNRCTQHHAVWDYYPFSRYGERIAIVGDERPVGVAG
jgi:taurine dioxygenase